MSQQPEIPPDWKERYGVYFPPYFSDFAIEQHLYLGKNGEHSAPGFLGQKQHFRNAMDLLFTHEGALPIGEDRFTWNPFAEEILDAYFDSVSRWTSICGHGSSSKSVVVAAIAVTDFLMDPSKTSCLLTSTTLGEGQKRVWAYVENFWFSAGVYFGGEDKLPGNLVSSIATIFYLDPETSRQDKSRGLALIPSGNDADDKVGISKMVGFKSPRLRLFIDEASHIKWKVVESAETNLCTGGVDFRVMATLNPNVKSDTGGKLCCPINAQGRPDWKAVDVNTLRRWQNERGITIRLDADHSPNIVLARNGEIAPHEARYKGLLTLDLLEEKKRTLSTPNYQRQYLAQWPETEAIETIFTDSEFKDRGAHLKVPRRASLEAKLRACDPSWTHDGDKAPLVFMDLIRTPMSDGGQLVLEFSHVEYMDADLDPTKDASIQIQNKLGNRLKGLDVRGRDFAIDITGGGRVIDDNVRVIWNGSGRLAVAFSGAPTDKPTSELDRTPANEKYSNLSAQIWMFVKDLVASGQIKNLPQFVIDEFCARRYGDNSGRDTKGRITIEETRKMKKRIGKSPDVASAVAICCHLAHVNYGLIASSKPAKIIPQEPDHKMNGGFDFSRLQKHSTKGWRGLAHKYSGLANGPADVR